MTFKPYTHMNCQALKPKRFPKVMDQDPYIAQIKFKGIRAMLFIQNNTGTLMTRGGHYEPITSNFSHICAGKHLAPFNNCVLDGELWAPGYRDETIAGFANGLYTGDQRTRDIGFYAFDVLCAWGTDASCSPLKARLQALETMATQFTGPLIRVDSFPPGHHQSLLERVWHHGGEGIVLKNLNSVYHPCPNGKRPPIDTWFKLKSTRDFDVIVTGWKPAKEGKFEGLVGSLELSQYRNGALISVGHASGFDLETRENITHNFADWNHTVIEVLAAERDDRSGMLIEPRFIRRRPDKEPNECVWYDD